MLTLSSTSRVFVYTGVTDMRKSFNGLSGLVATHFRDVELLSGHLFLFFQSSSRQRQALVVGSGWLGDLVQASRKGYVSGFCLERNGKLSGDRFDAVVATPLGHRLGFSQTT